MFKYMLDTLKIIGNFIQEKTPLIIFKNRHSSEISVSFC